jgi:ABC-2 type transport system permease protein
MKRYLRLYLHFLRFSFSKAMEFRLDFTFRFFMDIIYYLVNIYFFKIIYLHTPMLVGWREDQIMVFVGAYLLVDAINMTVFSSNLWMLSAYINKGDLDYYLLRPVSPLFFLSLREFSANSFMNLIIALLFFIYSLTQLQGSIAPLELLLFVLLLINGTLLYYCIQMITIIPVFWTHSARGFVDLFYSMTMAMERPDKIFTRWLRPLFTIILPFSLIASFPARLFLDGFDWQTFLHLSAVTVVVWIVMLSFWKAGLRNYSSASS